MMILGGWLSFSGDCSSANCMLDSIEKSTGDPVEESSLELLVLLIV
jgi:hypothetical protein